MSQLLRCCTYTLFVFALLSQTELRADSIPTVTITSATGGATWGLPPGISAGLSGSGFALSFDDFVPSVYFNANAGSPFDPFILGLHEYVGAPAEPTGFLLLNGTGYPVVYNDVSVIPEAFTVPSGYATVEVPASLDGMGMACTAIYAMYGCFPPPNTVPYPVVVGDVNLDIPGFLTVAFHPAFGPNIHNEAFVATFTPTPEPSNVLLVTTAIILIVLTSKKIVLRD